MLYWFADDGIFQIMQTLKVPGHKVTTRLKKECKTGCSQPKAIWSKSSWRPEDFY
jgi:hypothetical protein